MALQRGWFRHARRDFGRFASLGTKRIGTWPYITSPWVTGCPNMALCLISLLTFYFLGNIPFHLFHCCSNGLGCGLRLFSHLGSGHHRKGCSIQKGYAHAMENLSIAQHRNTLWYAHTQGGSYKPKVRQFDVGDFVYF
jgi:hypothetical protein